MADAALLAPPAPSLIDLDATYLPVALMRQIARVTAVTPESITGEVDVGPGHWVYAQHFPGDPIFPGTLMIEAAGQLIALFAWARGQRGRPRLVRTSAEFRHPVSQATPSLRLDARVRSKRNIHFGTVDVHAGEYHVARVEAVLAVIAL